MQSIDSLLSNYIKNDTDSLDVFTCPHCYELPVGCLPNLLQDFPNCQMIRLRCPKGSKPCNRQSYFVCVDCKKRYQRLKPAEKHYEKNHTPPPQPTSEEFTPGTIQNSNGKRNLVSAYQSTSDCQIQGQTSTTKKLPQAAQNVISIDQFAHNVGRNKSWLESLLENQPVATLPELQDQFQGEALENFFLFWAMEQKQKNLGGLLHLVLKAFRGDTLVIDGADEMPTPDESRYHLLSFLHLLSLNDKQRMRYAHLIKSTYYDGCSHCKNSLFKETYLPSYNNMSSVYFGTNTTSSSMWNNLPIPRSQAIGDIAYVNPIDICRFAFSIGIDIDRIYVGDNAPNNKHDHKIYQISESPAIASLKNRARNGKKFTLVLWMTDWRDAFGPCQAKNNRKSVHLYSLSVSPTHDNVNTTKNTFPVAIGLKSSIHWPAVEHRFRKDTECLEDPTKPLMLYHGPSNKIVPVLISRICSIEDKPERASMTRTLFGSSYHKVFGIVGYIGYPHLRDIKVLTAFYHDLKKGACDSMLGYGWSFQFVDHNHPIGNSARLASCFQCRKKRILRLQGIPSFHDSTCQSCADWQFNDETADILKTPLQGKDATEFPKIWDTENCPVRPPAGREPVQNMHIVHKKLSFSMMKQAARFSFYHLVTSPPNGRKGSYYWTQAAFKSFLRTCGFNADVRDQLYDVAKLVREEKHNQNTIDYADPCGIDDFKFPASWISPLPLSSYVEALMHSLYHGMTCSLFFMVLSLASKQKKQAAYLANSNKLLSILKKFGLSWLNALPTRPETSSITGAWVGENWSAWARISQICCGWFCKDGTTSARQGCNDIMRAMISSNCLISRVMTRSGVDDAFVKEFDDYVKESLNCSKELFLRTSTYPAEKGAEPLKKKKAPPKKGKQTAPSPTTHIDLANVSDKEASATAPQEKPTVASPKATVPSPKKEEKETWLNSNFLCLLNLPAMMQKFGPLSNLYDAGGKGEKMIQEVKPEIPNSLRAEMVKFFQTIQEKWYGKRFLKFLEEITGLTFTTMEEEDSSPDNNDCGYVMDQNGCLQSTDPTEDKEGNDPEEENRDYSAVEGRHMMKVRTVYVYRTIDVFLEGFNNLLPLAGFLVDAGDKLEMRVAYRQPGRQFGWRSIVFNDESGTQFSGMWWATINHTEVGPEAPVSVEEVKKISKMAAIAIPMHYSIGPDKPDSMKYCVITNWWKQRNMNGNYVLPNIDDPVFRNSSQGLFSVTENEQESERPDHIPAFDKLDDSQFEGNVGKGII